MDASQSIMLRERRQAQEATYSMISFIWHSRKDKSTRTEIRNSCQGLGVEERAWLQNSTRELFGVIKILYIFIRMVITWHYAFVKIHQIAPLKRVTLNMYKIIIPHKSEFKRIIWDVENKGKICMYQGRGTWEISVPSPWPCYEPKTAQKNSLNF